MKYGFNDILSQDMYDKTDVMFVAGQYNIFNNIVVDTLKEMCAIKTEGVDLSGFDEFSINDGVELTDNVINFETFMQVINVSNPSGKWFCRVELDSLSKNKKQLEFFNNYIKSPSSNGVLVVVSNDFRKYVNYLRNYIFERSEHSHLISLSFPLKRVTTEIVKALFEDRGKVVEPQASDLFITRMSTKYDFYIQTIDSIVLTYKDNKASISYKMMFEAMKGVEYFELDDFLDALTQPLSSNLANGKKIYKMLVMLLQDYEPSALVNKLRNKIETLIEFRILVNKGIIPVLVDYSVIEAKSKLDPESKIAKMSDYTFKDQSILSAKTSLRDWVCMKMILGTVSNKSGEEANERALYSLVTRTVFTENRLENVVGVTNIYEIINEEITGVRYMEQFKIERDIQ